MAKRKKGSEKGGSDWFLALSNKEREGINRGIQDIKNGRVIDHEIVKQRFGL